jgi:protein-tyrosine phosphatase
MPIVNAYRQRMTGGDPSGVLVICTANRCRSPLAEQLLGRALREQALGWVVQSAGTDVRGNELTDPAVLTVLAERGIHASPWQARPLVRDLIDESELVLTAERAHRGSVLRLQPNAVHRTFTLLEFARMLTAVPPDKRGAAATNPADLIAHAEVGRPYAGVPRSKDDLRDPIGRPLQQFRECADAISDAIDRILAAAAGSSPRDPA